MIYDLPLDLPRWIISKKDNAQDKIHKEQIEYLSSLEKKLIYFNANIRNLSTYLMKVKIEFE